MIRRPSVLLLTLLVCAALAAARAQDGAQSDAPFLWQVQGPRATHYLLGSVHLLPDADDELPAGIEDAYDAVDGLVFETDIGTISQPQVQVALLAAARAPAGLNSEVGARTYARVRRRAAQLGMPAEVCDPFKAWFCAMTLEVFAYRKAGFTGDYGVDRQLYRWAREDGKSIRWFEPPAQHLGLFTGMDERLSRELLDTALDEDPVGDDPAALLRAWRDNDVAAVEKLTDELRRRHPRIYAHLLSERNRRWLPQLVRILDGASPQMVVVGAAHWVGRDGLLALLVQRGYRVLPYLPSGQQLVTLADRPRGAAVR
jgi:uncharacterized protein YbaP (TraB family)